MLALRNAFGNLNTEGPVSQHQMTCRVDFRNPQGDFARGASEGLFKVYEDRRMMVLAARVVLSSAAGRGFTPAHSSKQRFEEITRCRAGAFRWPASEFKSGVPIGRRSEFLALLPVVTQLIIGGALFRVAQRGVGLADFLELRLSRRILVDIGVVLAGELAVGALDLVLRRAFLEAQNPVVVFELHEVSHGDEAGAPC